MPYAPSPSPVQRRSLVAILFATTAAGCLLLGGCTQTGKLWKSGSGSDEVQMSAAEATNATSKWASAYEKKPQDPKTALGYAKALKAIGSRERALQVLTASYQANPDNGEISAELGRLALEAGRLDIATATLKTAETKGVRDWKTLSAQGTLHAKQGNHPQAQQYFLAALQEKPDSVSVINNLALSYALDGKAGKSEQLLRKAVASGHEDKRVRQNLALVLGLQGKFDEARQVASAVQTADQAKSNMAYLRNMVSNPTQVAERDEQDDEWQPFADKASAKPSAPVKTAASPAKPKMQVAVPKEELKPSVAPSPIKTAGATTTKTKTASANQAKPAAGKTSSASAPAMAAPMGITPSADAAKPTRSGWFNGLFNKTN
jgi:Flp pilus assembly protein TadD